MSTKVATRTVKPAAKQGSVKVTTVRAAVSSARSLSQNGNTRVAVNGEKAKKK
jgi:hypothetical protein